ncbi:MAG: amidohydrolase family protein [Candidatus Thorarchaeota archaeon]
MDKMNKILIRNGLLFDPINKINGEIKDILIESGKIVESLTSEKNVVEINAKGKTVIPAALDIHTHIASQQVNWARLLGSQINKFVDIWQGLKLEKIARSYISNGYTFITEANVFPSLAKQTIFNFKHIAVLDKAMLLNVSNLWPLELEFQRGKIKDLAIFFADLLLKTKSFGLKIYNPFENESWNFKELRNDISKNGRLYNFSALDVYQNLIECNEFLGLPHSAHAHIEGYEHEVGKKNLMILLEKLKSLNIAIKPNLNRSQIFHIAHANTYNSDGDNERLIKILNETPNIGIDVGFLAFNEINPLITSDRRLINSMIISKEDNNSHKLISSAVESEGDSFVSIRHFDKNRFEDCILWANALDLALNLSNKFQISFSLNYPNYANITDIPEIITWLISKKARDDYMRDMNHEFMKNNYLKDNNKVLDFFDLITITRASPAKSLGLGKIKGNLGIGADGDLNILDIDISKWDLSKDYTPLKKAFKNMEIVIKSGLIIKRNDNFDLNTSGLILWSNGKDELEEKNYIIGKKKEYYQKYSSMFYDSLKNSVDEKLLRKIE